MAFFNCACHCCAVSVQMDTDDAVHRDSHTVDLSLWTRIPQPKSWRWRLRTAWRLLRHGDVPEGDSSLSIPVARDLAAYILAKTWPEKE